MYRWQRAHATLDVTCFCRIMIPHFKCSVDTLFKAFVYLWNPLNVTLISALQLPVAQEDLTFVFNPDTDITNAQDELVTLRINNPRPQSALRVELVSNNAVDSLDPVYIQQIQVHVHVY